MYLGNTLVNMQSLIDIEIETVSDAFYKEGMRSVCLIASLVLAKRLRKRGVNVSLKDGYFVFTQNGYAGRHVWLEDDQGHKIDVSRCLMKKHVPHFPEYVLQYALPANASRIDNETADERKDLAQLETSLACTRSAGEEAFWSLPGIPQKVKKICHKLMEQ